MNEIIKCKTLYFENILKKFILICLAVSVLIFFGLDVDISYRYFLSMILIFSGLLIVFYINRDEPELIKCYDDKLEFTFFNKVFFKREPLIYEIENLKFDTNEEMIKVFTDKELIAIIRKSAISLEEFEKLKLYFQSTSEK